MVGFGGEGNRILILDKTGMILQVERTFNLGGGLKYVLFSPLPGEMIQFDEHIFEMGWNHQLVNVQTIDFQKSQGMRQEHDQSRLDRR